MAFITFQIDYHTTWGQEVCLSGSLPEMGSFDESKAILLTNNGDTWSIELKINSTITAEYYYFIRERETTVRREWGNYRKLFIPETFDFLINDHWKNRPYHSYLYTSLFSESIFNHNKELYPETYFSKSVFLNVVCPYVGKDQELVICGESSLLGGWNPEKALPLFCTEFGEWQILLNADELNDVTAYKFAIVDKKSRKAIHWEEGGNRILNASNVTENEFVFVEMGLIYHHHTFKYKGKGTSIPLFSLKSDDSFGVGDFTDLHVMVDWIDKTDQQIIQLLPVNDTTSSNTWRDSYPYSAISNYALHPIYIGCKSYPLDDKKKNNAFLDEAKKLNSLSELNYEKVLNLKNRYSRELYKQNGEKVFSTDEYKTFISENESWLFPYACYCLLRDRNGSSDFKNWGEHKEYDELRLKRMTEIYPDTKNEIHYWYFIQFLLHKQFSEVKEYANSKGVSLKGDIPIGISRESVDAWITPHLFNMDRQTGAPPDDFSFFGQNWGFPTYNWQAIEKEDFEWWKMRFRKMADYFDAYRIDHILGFFRIWEIPLDAVQGLLGYFNPALPYWADEINYAGIPFDEDRMVEPFIHENFLIDIFGDFTEEVKNKYLDISEWQKFKLKAFCNTQQKIKRVFEDKHDEKNAQIRDGLYSLCAEVLFVRDPKDHNRFHPRITAQYTYSYKFLDDNVKYAFNKLYDEFFFHRHNYFWREQAMRKLPYLISSTSMMVCGEDLGMVPDCVPSVMNELQILSLEIERMPKSSNVKFTDLNNVPYLSVCTTSTHDMSPIRLWWTENREVTQLYYNNVLLKEGEAPEECDSELCNVIIKSHLNSSAMWVILPLQDWLSLDTELRNPDSDAERINVPSNPQHYWKYRMHISINSLLKEGEFNSKIQNFKR